MDRFSRRTQFLFYLVVAFFLTNVPIISLPFNWLETFFHEISHGLVAIVTGGEIVHIRLFSDGSGYCQFQGGWLLLVSLSGYLGAALWGYLIYQITWYSERVSRMVVIALLVLLVMTMVLWVRDVLTSAILFVLVALFTLTLKWSSGPWVGHLLRIFGLVVLINSWNSPFFLVDGQSRGDGAQLADITFIPEIIWVSLWVVLATSLMWKLMLNASRPVDASK